MLNVFSTTLVGSKPVSYTHLDVYKRQVCTTCLQAFRLLTLYLKPVLPAVAARVEAFLNVPPMAFADAASLLPAGHTIGNYEHLMTRVDIKQLEMLFEPRCV